MLHHITAIAGGAQRNYDFYARLLGLRLVKKTVNFDDPGTYHFYYGDERGAPGTLLTFFPWEGVQRGRPGPGSVSAATWAAPEAALPYWKERLGQAGLAVEESERFGRRHLTFADPDGLPLEIGALDAPVAPWAGAGVPAGTALRGFSGVTLTVRRQEPTASVLTGLLGYRHLESEGPRHRYVQEGAPYAAEVDLLVQEGGGNALGGGGTVHHVAFRVPDEATLMQYRDRVEGAGLSITPKIDRDYFFSLYFREPGGVLFEIATDNPGFLRDEPLESLGASLRLPARYEAARPAIEAALPPLQTITV